ncbi:54S ribosomal protein L3 [Annulohypoxylon moriforme]|nr:54S ribosomal protein L3 [Annulohypoxylon moriforme]
MKRIRLDRLSSQLLSSTPTRPASTSHSTRICRTARTSRLQAPLFCPAQRRWQSTTPELSSDEINRQGTPDPSEDARTQPLPSPPPERALYSAKLAALHARLSLSSKIPLQVLARALIDPSADAHPRYNNANLAFLGAALLQYHTSEFLVMRYPRLPMAILFAAMKGYSGVPALHQIARSWGVEPCAAPGEEVDPGVLQFSTDKPTVMINKWGYVRAESKELLKYKWRRGVSSRVVYDDAFGDMVQKEKKPVEDSEEVQELDPEKEESEGNPVVSDARNTKDLVVQDPTQNAHANFVRAVVGAIYQYCGRETAKVFVQSHVLSRKLDLENLFEFKLPIRELARLCAREDFDDPVARLLSETGRLSRTPVFVVGIYSGRDKLGEGTGPSLDAARTAAAINSLKAWYLYSPGEVGVPSDTFTEDAAHWEPAYVDIGEIIS